MRYPSVDPATWRSVFYIWLSALCLEAAGSLWVLYKGEDLLVFGVIVLVLALTVIIPGVWLAHHHRIQVRYEEEWDKAQIESWKTFEEGVNAEALQESFLAHSVVIGLGYVPEPVPDNNSQPFYESTSRARNGYNGSLRRSGSPEPWKSNRKTQYK